MKKLPDAQLNYLIYLVEQRMQLPGSGGIDQNVNLIAETARQNGFSVDLKEVKEKLTAKLASEIQKELLLRVLPYNTLMA